MNWLKKLFSFKTKKQLEKEVAELKSKLDERQEAINKTNAYWKKKFNDLKRRTGSL